MSPTEDLAVLDAGWGETSSNAATPAKPRDLERPEGAFGHVCERRLGLRVPASFWALLRGGAESVYARAVELSPTGTVLKLLDHRVGAPFDAKRTFGLDLFVPRENRPIHATVRRVRQIGELEAFEFLAIDAVDRLTLAEYLDRLAGKSSARRPPPSDRPRTVMTPWKRFILAVSQAPG